MKKILVLFAVLATSLCIVLASCDDPETTSTVVDAIGAGATGWQVVGSADNESGCAEMVASAGYSYHRFNSQNGVCYGKN